MPKRQKKQELHSGKPRELDEEEVIVEEAEVVVKQEVVSWVIARGLSETLLPVVLSLLAKLLLMLDTAEEQDEDLEAAVEEVVVVTEEEVAEAVVAAAVEVVLALRVREVHHTAVSLLRTAATFPRTWMKQTKDLAKTSISSTLPTTMMRIHQPQTPTWHPSVSTALNIANERSLWPQMQQNQKPPSNEKPLLLRRKQKAISQ